MNTNEPRLAILPHDPPARVLILGLGNDILTDDAVGLHVARALRQELKEEPDVVIEETCEMGLALLDFLTAGYREVLIVDSLQTGRVPPGTVHELDAAGLKQLTGRPPHFLGVGETLAFGRMLGLAMPERVRIFAVEVEDPFRLGAQMTPALADAVPTVVQRIRCALESPPATSAGVPLRSTAVRAAP